jgi:Bacterial PH domain
MSHDAMSHDDFEFEPIRGLPAMLPPGETLLWQGSPQWKPLAVRAYHVRKVAIYFCALALWRIAVGIYNHHTPAAVAASCVFLLALGGLAIAVLSVLAYLNARSTVYSITTRRLLLRHGVAVPLTMNIPFTQIESADLRSFADGTGDLALRIARTQRIGYLITWPHLRPGHITRPAPCFRALSDAAHAARLLGAALTAESNAAIGAPPANSARPSFTAQTAAA